MGSFKPLGLLLLLLVLLTLGSCGGKTNSLTNDNTGTQITGGIPSIWDLDSLPNPGHGASSTGQQQTVPGASYLEMRNGTVDGTSLVLDSSLGGDGEHIAWGLYRFTGLTGASPQSLDVEAIPGGLDQTYYIGLANFSSGSWEWFGPAGLPEYMIDLSGSNHRYITDTGNMYFVVVTHDGNVARHNQSTLTFTQGDGGTLPGAPRELAASKGTFADHVHLGWLPGTGATSYEVFRRQDGSNSEFAKIGNATGTEYDDTTVTQSVTYIYKVRSKNDAGVSDFSNTDHGYSAPQGGGDNCPTHLAATDGTYTDKVRLEWTGNAAMSYGVYRIIANGGGSSYERIGSSQGNTYNDTTATAGVTYNYKVALENDNGAVCWSNDDNGWRAQGDGAGCPSNLAATDGTYTDKVRLEWAGTSGLNYKIYRTDSTANPFVLIGDTSQGTSFDDTTAEPGVTYYYKVLLYHSDGSYCQSNIDAGYRGSGGNNNDCPTNLGASDGTYTDKVRLEWTGNANLAYDVYRAIGDAFDLIGTSAGVSYDDLTATPGQVYHYKVVLTAGGGTCSSNIDSGYRASSGDNCPSNFAASDGTWASEVHMEWTGNAGVGYMVWRRLHGTDGQFTNIGTTQQGLSYDDTTAEAGVTYDYKVSYGTACESNIDTGFWSNVP